MTTIDERTIAQVMDAMPYGLYIIASTGNTGPNGMMADWVTQLSFRPRLIGIALENDAHTLANVRQSGLFTLNLLEESTEGMALARRFASPYSASKIGGALAHGVHRKLIEEPHRLTTRGCPVLEAAVAWLECSTRQFGDGRRSHAGDRRRPGRPDAGRDASPELRVHRLELQRLAAGVHTSRHSPTRQNTRPRLQLSGSNCGIGMSRSGGRDEQRHGRAIDLHQSPRWSSSRR